jgi:hypothetical protein
VPELQLDSFQPDSVTFSWSLPPGSVLDYFTANWTIQNNSKTAQLSDILPSTSNSYTLTGLKDYSNANYTITVTAFNGVGNSTSSRMKIRSNIDTACGVSGSVTSDSEVVDKALIAGVVVGVVVVLVIATAVLGLLVYNCKSQKQNS